MYIEIFKPYYLTDVVVCLPYWYSSNLHHGDTRTFEWPHALDNFYKYHIIYSCLVSSYFSFFVCCLAFVINLDQKEINKINHWTMDTWKLKEVGHSRRYEYFCLTMPSSFRKTVSLSMCILIHTDICFTISDICLLMFEVWQM